MKYSYYTSTFLFVEIELESKIVTGRSLGLQSTVKSKEEIKSQDTVKHKQKNFRVVVDDQASSDRSITKEDTVLL